jgi:hypothetical protein
MLFLIILVTALVATPFTIVGMAMARAEAHTAEMSESVTRRENSRILNV